MTNKINTQLKVLSYYQIVGGIIGLGLTIWLTTTIVSFHWLLLLLFLIAVLLYAFSIYCGFMLLKNIELGLKFSKINQLFQVIHFSILGYAFKYISGIHFSIGLALTESLNFQFDLSFSSWEITINDDDLSIIISLNLVALFLIAFIDQLKTRMKTDQFQKQIFEIGQKSIDA
jgi:hypothetical protein